MMNLPISDYIKNYYREHNIVLDDFTQAAIIDSERQEWLDWSKQISMLQEIAERTTDKELKLQIEENIAYRLEEKFWFMDNRDRMCFYDSAYCKYDTIEQVIERGKQSDKSEIHVSKFDKHLCKVAASEEALVADAIWDKDGKTLLRLVAYKFEKDYPENTHGKKKRFDRCLFVPCEFPFERGDIVRDIKTGEIGVLQTSRSDWEKLVQRDEKGEYQTNRFYNTEVTVRRVISYNRPHLFDDNHKNLLHLEKITETQSNIDKDILHCIFRTMDENIVITNSLSDTEADRKIGLWFYYGDGVPQNDEIAFEWLRFAAGNHDNEARYWVGKLYAEGRGISQDFTRAFNWYLAAARHGHVEAQFEVGRYYADGIGVPSKHKKAVEWFQKAADQGHVKACLRLTEIMM